MVQRGPGGGAGVGTPPHTIPCHASTMPARALVRSAGRKKAPASSKKPIDNVLVLC